MAFDLAFILFRLKKLVAILVLPPLGPLLLTALGLLLLPRRPRLGRALAWSGLAAALLLTLPVSVGWLLADLETAPPLTPEAAAKAQAIVILGGGKRRNAPEFGGETVNRLSLERVRYGARVARATGLPVLVSGGAPTGERPEAELMKDALEKEFGVQVRWVEGASRDTRQNARFSAVQLHAAGVRRILLVTHAAHMPRARAEFEAAGMEVIPAPTAWQGGLSTSEQVWDFLPGPTSAYAGWYALHEWLGLAAQRVPR